MKHRPNSSKVKMSEIKLKWIVSNLRKRKPGTTQLNYIIIRRKITFQSFPVEEEAIDNDQYKCSPLNTRFFSYLHWTGLRYSLSPLNWTKVLRFQSTVICPSVDDIINPDITITAVDWGLHKNLSSREFSNRSTEAKSLERLDSKSFDLHFTDGKWNNILRQRS